MTKLNNLRVENIRDYAHSYGAITDAKADELVQNAFNYRKQRSELLVKYYGRVKDSLGAVEAARFLQIEDQLLATHRSSNFLRWCCPLWGKDPETTEAEKMHAIQRPISPSGGFIDGVGSGSRRCKDNRKHG